MFKERWAYTKLLFSQTQGVFTNTLHNVRTHHTLSIKLSIKKEKYLFDRKEKKCSCYNFPNDQK